ncbi:aspartate 1-decarboxylase [Bradyrhizobium sacchari]|uniref:aspartate 1-decarboxylase n=1 Tax=Bradyrhizobium sacchari TaxID=1399419 RepID=UPI0009AFC1C0|nr:aspartate 1-decarboxylase [Bradyrhizobium sacchari]
MQSFNVFQMRKVDAAKDVTEGNLQCHGSSTFGPDHCFEAAVPPTDLVEIWKENSGGRISSYVILGARRWRCWVLDGAVARI